MRRLISGPVEIRRAVVNVAASRRWRVVAAIAAAVALSSVRLTPARAAFIEKANNTSNLNLPASWQSGVVPGPNEVAEWSSILTAANASTLGGPLSWAGISVTNPGGGVTINGIDTLTLGRSGIDLSSASQNLTLNCNPALLGNVNQVWTVSSGHLITLGGGAFTRNAGATLELKGAGSVFAGAIPGFTNNAAGIIGAWVTTGSGSGTTYVTLGGLGPAPYTGATTGAAGTIPAGSTASNNYKITTAGTAVYSTGRTTFTLANAAGASTLTFGNSSTLTQLVTNGILNSGTGALTIAAAGGNAASGIQIGATGELVLNPANAEIDIAAPIVNGTAGASAVTITGDAAGSPRVVLSGENTYTGPTVITQAGSLYLGDGGTAGSLSPSGAIIDNGALYFNKSSAIIEGATFGGTITGTGTVNQRGTGAVTLPGVNTYTGRTTVTAGTLNVSGSIPNTNLVVLSGGTTNVTGTLAATNSSALIGDQGLPTGHPVLNVSLGGTFTAGYVAVGDTDAPAAIYQTGTSTVNAVSNGFGDLVLGSNTSAYGYYQLTGGTLNADELEIGGQIDGFTDDTVGVMNVSGGTAVVNGTSGLRIGSGGGTSSAALTVLGGSITATRIDMNQATTAGGASVLTVGGGAGTASVTTNGNVGNSNGLNVTAGGSGTSGTVNLRTSGTLTTGIVFGQGSGSSTGRINFNGGTLRATAITVGPNFMSDTNLGVYVYAGGGTIDNNGANITLAPVLRAPTGNGVGSATISAGGSGYVGSPLVAITGGGGSGATGYAVVNGAGGVTGIVITNPGIGYTSTPTITLTGGGGTGAVASLATVANAGGGLTFAGSGTTSLTGANTYTGATTVAGGTVRVRYTPTGISAASPLLTGPGGANIQNGQVLFDYTAVASPAATLRGLLVAAHNSGFLTGQLRSSTATASRGLGYRDNGAAAGTVIVKATLYGDADLDGGVSINDFNALAGNFGQANGRVWVDGDFDYDGGVSINDFNLLAGNFGQTLPASAEAWAGLLAFAAAHDDLAAFAAITGVPEPTSLGVVAAGFALGLRRQRRRVG